jgi:hypothetical protein
MSTAEIHERKISLEEIWESSPVEIDRILSILVSIGDLSTPPSGTLLSKRLRLAYIYFKDGMLDQEGQKYLRIPSFKRLLVETNDLKKTKSRLEAQLAIGEVFPEGNLFDLLEDFIDDVDVYVLNVQDHSDDEDMMINETIEESYYYENKTSGCDYSDIPGLPVGSHHGFKHRGWWCTRTVPVKGVKFLDKDMKLSPDVDISDPYQTITSFHPSNAGEKGLSIGVFYKEGLIGASRH